MKKIYTIFGIITCISMPIIGLIILYRIFIKNEEKNKINKIIENIGKTIIIILLITFVLLQITYLLIQFKII